MITSRLMRGLYAALLLSALPFASAAKTVVATTPAPVTAANAARVTNLKNHGDLEIERRLAALNTAVIAVNATAKLSASDKTALTNQIQDEITALTGLKAKLVADTTLAAARADVASIVTDYRVYALMLPKARLVAAADYQIATITLLTDLSNKLETRITAAKSNGKDVATAQATLSALKAKLTSASTATADVATKVLALQPADVNANRAALTTYRQALGTAQTNLKGARTDAKTIIESLR